MRVRGTATITQHLILPNTGHTVPSEGLVGKAVNGTGRMYWAHTAARDVESGTIYKDKGSLAIYDEGLYYSLVDDADGADLLNPLVWARVLPDSVIMLQGSWLHEQTTASAIWTIPHMLDAQFLNVVAYGDTNQVMVPEIITAVDADNMTIQFETPVAGKAMLIGGLSESTAFNQDLQQVSEKGNHTTMELFAPNLVTNEKDTYPSVEKVSGMVTLTQVEYDAIATPDVNVLYIIIG